MSVKYIFDRIIEIMNEPNEDPSSDNISYYSFADERTKQEKSLVGKLHYVLSGNDKVSRYLNEFEKLYKEMNVNEKLMSSSAFRKMCEQAMFVNKFNEIEILKILEETQVEPFLNIAQIYGLQLEQETKKLGKYTMINKNYIQNYVKEIIKKNQVNFNFSLLNQQLKYDEKDQYEFVYLSYETKARDNKFAHYLFEEEKEKFIRLIRYMIGFKDERLYIDYMKTESYSTARLQISPKVVTFGSGLTLKDMTISLDHPTFILEKNGNLRIWEITQKSKSTKMEDRILQAIYWVGISIAETNSEIAFTELAIAFESLLKQNETGGPITSSIQGHISDMVAFIIGKTVTERKEIVAKFKKFYAYRSAIAHGGITKNKNMNYYDFLDMFKNTLKTLLIDEKFVDCQNIEQLIDVIGIMKYS